jgi:hypothetical protein
MKTNANGDDVVRRHRQTAQHVRRGPLTCCTVIVAWQIGVGGSDVATLRGRCRQAVVWCGGGEVSWPTRLR